MPKNKPHRDKIDVSKVSKDGLFRALAKSRVPQIEKREFPVGRPNLIPGVVPAGEKAPVMAMDDSIYAYASQAFPGGGFPGYPYLANLATRAEFRAMASALGTEITREWIEFTSKDDDKEDAPEKIKLIESEFKRLGVRGLIARAAEHDAYFGRAQIFLNVDGADPETPLVFDKRTTLGKGPIKSLSTVEPIWTTPVAYNSLDPAADDFYRPTSWFMLGKRVHASRLFTITTRPVPDILKPAYNFSGMSLSQLAEPYVDWWIRTKQSVSDLLYNFSITALATSMDQVLSGDDDGTNLFARAELFTKTRSNRGLMLLDKDREEISQINTPLSGLHELQAQAQEHICAISRMPAVILTGISPSGLNASSEGEIRVFYDWIAAQQEAHWREPIENILKAVQISQFGEIDPDIGFNFVPLYQLTETELADIRLKDSQAGASYIAAGVIDASEERERIARDPNSGYEGLSLEDPLPGLQGEEIDEDTSKKLGLAALLAKAAQGDAADDAEGKGVSEISESANNEFASNDD